MRLAFLPFLVAVACRAAPPVPPPVDQAAEAKEVHQALERWYTAIHNFDSAGIAGALTPTFLILEDTVPYDGPTLVREILRGRGAGSQVAALTDLKTRIHGDVAWTTLRNDEVWTPVKGTPDSLHFLETVVLQKVDGRWLIDRYHAARLPSSRR
jgi:ketosteroid isomerase-like protein